MKTIYKALANFQDEVPTIHEETKGYNYTYSNLNTIFKVIKPLLKKHGLGSTQLLDGKNLKTVIFHIETGETIEGSVEIETNVKLASMNHYQVFGSAITYFRRYSLSCALGLITDKDIDVKGDRVEKTPEQILKECKSFGALATAYNKLSKTEKEEMLSLKDELKLKLS